MEPKFTHIQLAKIGSTQDFLLGHPQVQSQFFLVSTLEQIRGKGRRANTWQSFPSGLFFSFNLPIQKNLPLSLHLGNAIVQYFLTKHKVELSQKWPNDIYTKNNKKCGGILTSRVKGMDIIGIGLNRDFSDHDQFDHIDLSSSNIEIGSHQLCVDIHNFILDFDQNFNKQQWLKSCIHLNKEVTLESQGSFFSGMTKGIDSSGGIIIESKEELKTFYSGSLLIS